MTTREKLLTTASKLFQINGYSATGLNKIIAESCTPKGSLYHYFPKGKLQLAIEAVNFAGTSINEKVGNRLAEHKEPVKAFQAVVNDIIDHFSEGSDFMDVSLSMISLEASSEAESLRSACEAVLNAREALYVNTLVSSGFQVADAKRVGALVQILIEGAIVATRTRNDPSALIEVSRFIPELLGKNDRQA